MMSLPKVECPSCKNNIAPTMSGLCPICSHPVTVTDTHQQTAPASPAKKTVKYQQTQSKPISIFVFVVCWIGFYIPALVATSLVFNFLLGINNPGLNGIQLIFSHAFGMYWAFRIARPMWPKDESRIE